MIELDRIPWQRTRYPGISIHFFTSDRSTDYAAVLIRMEPGSEYPAHRHRGSEELLILEGAYEDEIGIHRQGEFVRYPDGSSHHPRCPQDGERCTFFAITREGIEFFDAGQSTAAGP